MLCFLQKDHNGHTWKVNEFQYVLVRHNFKKFRNQRLGDRSVPPPIWIGLRYLEKLYNNSKSWLGWNWCEKEKVQSSFKRQDFSLRLAKNDGQMGCLWFLIFDNKTKQTIIQVSVTAITVELGQIYPRQQRFYSPVNCPWTFLAML